MDKSNESVALCMPVYDKVYPKAWLADMMIAFNFGKILKPENFGIFYVRKLPQPHAQNYLFNSVLDNKVHEYAEGFPVRSGRADWVLWVEDDSVPPANAYEILRKWADPIERPVMHGLSFDRKPPHSPSAVIKDDAGEQDWLWHWRPDALYKVEHSGTCISLIHTSVFEKMKRPWFRMQPFEPGTTGMIPCLSLSQRMHEAGIPIYLYTGCIAGHIADEVVIDAKIGRMMAEKHESEKDRT